MAFDFAESAENAKAKANEAWEIAKKRERN